jgi:hypothetical protein
MDKDELMRQVWPDTVVEEGQPGPQVLGDKESARPEVRLAAVDDHLVGSEV